MIIGAVVLGSLWIGSSSIVDRLTKNNVVSADEKAESFEDSRGWIWNNSITMFQTNPIGGVGMGAFETAYPKYSSDNSGLSQTVDRAHNDYLQVLTDAGLIGGAIALSVYSDAFFRRPAQSFVHENRFTQDLPLAAAQRFFQCWFIAFSILICKFPRLRCFF